MTEGERIAPTEMRDAISRSGYMMEQRIFPVLERRRFYVESNPVYPDPATGKPREYDFTALTAYKPFKEERDSLFTEIIGECINNAQPVVFFKAESPVQFLFHEQIRCYGMPLYYKDEVGGEEVSLSDYFKMNEFHHYCRGTFSTQYCSFQKKAGKGAQWMAWHDEEHHSIFNSLIEATKFSAATWFSHWRLPIEGEVEPVNLTFSYPLLVLKEGLYEFSQKGQRVSLRPKEHVQFRKPVITEGQPDTYHVDVIVERFLPKYLTILEKEAQSLMRRLRRRKRNVRMAIEHIVTRAKVDAVAMETRSYRNVLEKRPAP